MTTAGLEPATFWCHLAIEAKRATIAPGSHVRPLFKELNHYAKRLDLAKRPLSRASFAIDDDTCTFRTTFEFGASISCQATLSNRSLLS